MLKSDIDIFTTKNTMNKEGFCMNRFLKLKEENDNLHNMIEFLKSTH